jgi:hypothetical protein
MIFLHFYATGFGMAWPAGKWKYSHLPFNCLRFDIIQMSAETNFTKRQRKIPKSW